MSEFPINNIILGNSDHAQKPTVLISLIFDKKSNFYIVVMKLIIR